MNLMQNPRGGIFKSWALQAKFPIALITTGITISSMEFLLNVNLNCTGILHVGGAVDHLVIETVFLRIAVMELRFFCSVEKSDRLKKDAL